MLVIAGSSDQPQESMGAFQEFPQVNDRIDSARDQQERDHCSGRIGSTLFEICRSYSDVGSNSVFRGKS
jgi:hypothetical protein